MVNWIRRWHVKQRVKTAIKNLGKCKVHVREHETDEAYVIDINWGISPIHTGVVFAIDKAELHELESRVRANVIKRVIEGTSETISKAGDAIARAAAAEEEFGNAVLRSYEMLANDDEPYDKVPGLPMDGAVHKDDE